MSIQKINKPNLWFLNGIPPAYSVAPWQAPYLNTKVMFPDETGTISYELNSLGYRDKEWSTHDLNGSIWCVGHSDVFGIGVQKESTWQQQIPNSINLGIAGAAWDTISRIVSSGLAAHTPMCVIIQTTTKERKEYISEKKQQVVLPNMPKKFLPHNEIWKYDDDVFREYCYEKNLALISWACKAKNIPLIIFELPNRWDLIKHDPAADNQHIGVNTHTDIATYLKHELQLLGILYSH